MSWEDQIKKELKERDARKAADEKASHEFTERMDANKAKFNAQMNEVFASAIGTLNTLGGGEIAVASLPLGQGGLPTLTASTGKSGLDTRYFVNYDGDRKVSIMKLEIQKKPVCILECEYDEDIPVDDIMLVIARDIFQLGVSEEEPPESTVHWTV